MFQTTTGARHVVPFENPVYIDCNLCLKIFLSFLLGHRFGQIRVTAGHARVFLEARQAAETITGTCLASPKCSGGAGTMIKAFAFKSSSNGCTQRVLLLIRFFEK
jgi:hypothetical protein